MNWIKLRWALLLLFLIPVFDLGSPFQLADEFSAFVLEMVISLAACALLLTRLDRMDGRTLWVWVLLGLFLQGYYIKGFLYAGVVSVPGSVFRNPELNWLSIHTIAAGFRYTTVAFVVACVFCWLALGRRRGPVPTPPAIEAAEASTGRAAWLALAVTALTIGAGFVQAWLGIGIMGVSSERLPMRLDTVLFRFRSDLAPTWVLLALWVLDRPGRRRAWVLTLAAMLVVALIDGLVSSSRGTFVRLGLLVFFLWVLTGRLRRRRVLFLGLILVATVLLAPFFTTIRQLRMEASDRSQAVVSSAASSAWSGGLAESTASAAIFVGDRVSGTEGIWFAMGEFPDDIDWRRVLDHLFVEPLHIYYTRQIVGVLSPTDFRAPGLVAFFLMLGGTRGLVVFLTAYLLGFTVLWDLASRLQAAPVALALCVNALLYITMEGILGINNIVLLFIDIAAAEWLYTKYLARGAPAQLRLAAEGVLA
ncbi:MAG TPA: hypothetical protein VF590_03275 [Isosphaeraceae bacterium]